MVLPLIALGGTNQVLVTVGGTDITSDQLESTMMSTPMASQFPSMEEQDQARYRGEMLVRLVNAEILYQEAMSQNLDKETDYEREIMNFRTGLMAQRYQHALRDSIRLPQSMEKDIKTRLKGESNAQDAARSGYIAEHYVSLRKTRLEELKERYGVKVYRDRLQGQPAPDTILVEGNGFKIRYRDLGNAGSPEAPVDQNTRLNELTELLIFARAGVEDGLAIEEQLEPYRRTLLAKLLLDKKEHEWIPNREFLRDYYQHHPEFGYVPELREIAQLVVASKSEAEALRKRILQGESLYKLAEQYSIDTYGKQHSGEMGWLKEGSGMPEIEAAIKGLPDGQVSEVIKSSKGYHLVLIANRRPESRKAFNEIEDRLRRAVMDERMPSYMKELLAHHPVEWKMSDHHEVKLGQ
jgi:peptidyl-prolyl cis-trans isomerase C